jgi:hypothetical protein
MECVPIETKRLKFLTDRKVLRFLMNSRDYQTILKNCLHKLSTNVPVVEKIHEFSLQLDNWS